MHGDVVEMLLLAVVGAIVRTQEYSGVCTNVVHVRPARNKLANGEEFKSNIAVATSLRQLWVLRLHDICSSDAHQSLRAHHRFSSRDCFGSGSVELD